MRRLVSLTRCAGAGRGKYPALLACALLLPPAVVSFVSYRNTITPRGIVIHHSAVTTTSDGRPLDVPALAEYHRQRGFGAFYWGRTYHVGYHYIIFPDGRIEPGRPERCQGAHTAGHNSDLGICLIGNFSPTDNPAGERGLAAPTDAQMAALAELCRRLQARYDIPPGNVRRHRDVMSGTECPGDRFPFEKFTSQSAAAPPS